MEDTLGGALVAARIRIQHHRFPSFESFSGRITSLYVLNKGVDAPDFGEALFVSRPAGSDHANVGLKSMDSSDSVPSSSRNNIPHLSCSVADNAENDVNQTSLKRKAPAVENEEVDQSDSGDVSIDA